METASNWMPPIPAYRLAAPLAGGMAPNVQPAGRPWAMDRPVQVLPEPDMPWMDRRALRPALLAGRNANCGVDPFWVARCAVCTGFPSCDMQGSPSGTGAQARRAAR